MKEIKNEVLEEFSFSNDQLKDMKDKKIMFSGEICSKCKLYANVPRIEKTWTCYNCDTLNTFDFVNITIPFDRPDVGPSKRRIDYPTSYMNMDERDYYNGEFW